MKEGQRIVVAGGQPPWMDIIFAIPEWNLLQNSNGKNFISLDMQGDYSGREIGIGIDMLLDGWEIEQTDDFTYFWGDMRLRPTGHRTDNWLSAIEEFYKLHPKSGDLTKPLFCECVGFEVSPTLIEKAAFCGKLFFGDHGQPEERNAQLFVTIDLPNKRGWFTYKDEIHTPRIVKWLRGEFSRESE